MLKNSNDFNVLLCIEKTKSMLTDRSLLFKVVVICGLAPGFMFAANQCNNLYMPRIVKSRCSRVFRINQHTYQHQMLPLQVFLKLQDFYRRKFIVSSRMALITHTNAPAPHIWIKSYHLWTADEHVISRIISMYSASEMSHTDVHSSAYQRCYRL